MREGGRAQGAECPGWWEIHFFLKKKNKPISFLKDFFGMWTIFKVFIKFVTILLPFYVLVSWLQVMWGLSSLTRDRTCPPALEGGVLTMDCQRSPGKFIALPHSFLFCED